MKKCIENLLGDGIIYAVERKEVDALGTNPKIDQIKNIA